MRALIVDDHGLFRDGLRMQLMRIAPEVSIAEADSYAAATAAAAAEPFDYAFVDLMMQGQNWEIALPVLVDSLKPARVVVLSAIDDAERIQQTFRLGIVGFIPKSSDRRVILNALRLVLDGGSYLPPEMMLVGSRAQVPVAERPAMAVEAAEGPHLTQRQLEVLALLCEGRSNKQIAYSLTLSEATVKLHINSVMRALGAHNRTEAAMSAHRLGLIRG